jgi:hypothetical protein
MNIFGLFGLVGFCGQCWLFKHLQPLRVLASFQVFAKAGSRQPLRGGT